MDLKITESGVFDADNTELEIGSVITVEGDEIPAYLLNKAEKVAVTNPADTGAEEKVAVTNPKAK